MRNYKDKICEVCIETYKPTSSHQKYCLTCRDGVRQEQKREYMRDYMLDYNEKNKVAITAQRAGHRQSRKDGRWHVYAKTNLDNGMIYFGCAVLPDERWINQDSRMRNGIDLPPRMIADFQKGDMFVDDIVRSFLDKDAALDFEKYLIRTFGEHAYNIDGNPFAG